MNGRTVTGKTPAITITTCNQAIFCFLKGRRRIITPDTLIRPAAPNKLMCGWTVIYKLTRIHRKSNYYICTRHKKRLQNIIRTVTYIHPWKLGRVLKNKCVWKQGEMVLRKNKPCCYFWDINLPCILNSKLFITPLFVVNWRSLSWMSRPREQFKSCWTAPWKFSEWIYRRLRIITRTLKIEGYPRVEWGNVSPFPFFKQF